VVFVAVLAIWLLGVRALDEIGVFGTTKVLVRVENRSNEPLSGGVVTLGDKVRSVPTIRPSESWETEYAFAERLLAVELKRDGRSDLVGRTAVMKDEPPCTRKAFYYAIVEGDGVHWKH